MGFKSVVIKGIKKYTDYTKNATAESFYSMLLTKSKTTLKDKQVTQAVTCLFALYKAKSISESDIKKKIREEVYNPLSKKISNYKAQLKKNANTVEKLTFIKRSNPHGWSLYKGKNPIWSGEDTSKYFGSGATPGLAINTGTGGNCTWYAMGRFHEIWASAPKAVRKKYPWKGCFNENGENMVNAGAKKGYKKGSVPRVGAMVSFTDRHVAIVESVKYNKNKVPIKCTISQSSYHSGDMKDWTLKRNKSGKYVGGGMVAKNFLYNPIPWDGSITGGEVAETSGTGIDMQKRASKLISSDNYSFLSENERFSASENTGITASKNQGKSFVSSFKNALQTATDTLTKNSDVIYAAPKVKEVTATKMILDTSTSVFNVEKTSKNFQLTNSLVEAPYIELVLGGHTIGSYKGSTDKFPNYIDGLSVKKINGLINQYTIKLIHQIRANDDPNILDEILSSNGYNKFTIRYGDCNSNQLFQDTKAIITNVTMSRNYTSQQITYTISGTSDAEFIKTYVTNFPSVTDKPSNVIRNLLYNSGKISTIIQNAFTGMKNQDYVSSNNLIPTNDSIVNIDEQLNMDTISYINYLVSCMSNQSSGDETIRNSTYYISYVDSTDNNGSYFKISEVTSNSDATSITNNIYDLNVGYPDNNMVFSFNVTTDNFWGTLYNNSNIGSEYAYTITNNGITEKTYSPTLTNATNLMSEVNKNWWTQMTTFPINATVQIRGLLKPIMLMDYVNVNVVFYGQTHITSGTYAITGQQDTLDKTGFRTTLSLVRVGANS